MYPCAVSRHTHQPSTRLLDWECPRAEEGGPAYRVPKPCLRPRSLTLAVRSLAPAPPQDARLTPSGQPEGTTAVIAYAGRFLPRLPLQRSVPVLLKVRQGAGRLAGVRSNAPGVRGEGKRERHGMSQVTLKTGGHCWHPQMNSSKTRGNRMAYLMNHGPGSWRSGLPDSKAPTAYPTPQRWPPHTAIFPATRPAPLRPQEYLPVAHAVAYNELLVLHRLLGGLPQDTYEVGRAQSPKGRCRPRGMTCMRRGRTRGRREKAGRGQCGGSVYSAAPETLCYPRAGMQRMGVRDRWW